MLNNEKLKELEELGKPLVEFLRKHYHPHANIVISTTSIRVTEDALGVGVPYKEEE